MVGFPQFIRERQYLHNVAPTTLAWYENSLKWLSSPAPDEAALKDCVVRMREKGLKATGCNSVIQAINCYLKWSGSPLKIPPLKTPQLVLPTFTAAQVSLLVNWKPKNFYQRRLHLLLLILLDTGARISEALNLHVRDVDLENLLVTLDGKGRKQRVVPISFTLRKALFRYIRDHECRPETLLLVCRAGTRLSRRNTLRQIKALCRRLGFAPPARTQHAIRHSFALNYLRKGGSVFHLQKVLGHSSLEMTRRYANLMTEDLQAVHERVSLLSRG